MFWEDIMQKVKLPRDKITVQSDVSTDNLVSEYCEDPSLLLIQEQPQQETEIATSPQQELPDLIVCDFWIPRERPRIVAVGGTLLLYTRSIAKRQDDMTEIFPQSPITTTRAVDCLNHDARINVVLAVDDTRAMWVDDWKKWSDSLQDNLVQFQDSWQSLVRSPRYPIHFAIKVVRGATAVQTTVQNNQTMHYLDPFSINELFGTMSQRNNLDIIFYLPPKDVIFMEPSTINATTRMVTQGSRLVQILSLSPENVDSSTSMHELTLRGLGDATDWITRQCMSISLNEEVDEESLDGSLPRWYTKLWWQRTIDARYQRVLRMAQRQAHIWKEMSYRSPLTNDLVQEFEHDVLDAIEQVSSLLANQSLAQAIERLEHSLVLLQNWERDDKFMPPLDFPSEQYAAIFAPLVVPLLLPLLKGLVSEYKRYRELQKKKKEAQEKQKID